jgi:hypothetical protein
MATAAQRIADLEGQVADLATEVSKLRKQAFVVRTLEEMALERAGYGYHGTEGSALRAAWDAGRASVLEGAVGGGAS